MEARVVGYLLIRNTRCVEALSPASVVPERLTRKRVPFEPLNVSMPCDAVSLWLERLPLPMGCQAIFVPVTPDVCQRTLTWPREEEAFVNFTETDAETFVGNAPFGMTGEAPGDLSEVPTRLVAVTVTLYSSPLVSPPMTHLRPVSGAVHTLPPGHAVAVYELTGAPPSSSGAFHDTAKDLSPGSACTARGAIGTPAGVTATDDSEGVESPPDDAAVTRNV